MKSRAYSSLPLCLSMLTFAALLIFPAEASAGARAGLSVCAAVIIPSLLPFIVLSSLLMELGLPRGMAQLLAPVTQRLFGVSGQAGAVFFLGLAGGYPLGAITAAEMYADGYLEKKEAERLLGFCDNSGPAFIVAVAGSAIFGSHTLGFFLYFIHVFAAVSTGVVLRGKATSVNSFSLENSTPPSFSQAFSVSVQKAAMAAVSISGFVVFFSVIMSLLNASQLLPEFCGQLAYHLGLELHFTHSLVGGIFELGSGITSMAGLSLNAQNSALAAFIIGWGGLSIQAQGAAVIKESGLSAAKHLSGKLLHGVLSALLTYILFPLFF